MKILSLVTIDKWKKFALKVIKKIRNSWRADIYRLNIRAEVEIDKLRNTNEHKYKQEYLDRNLLIFGLPVCETPHFHFMKIEL